MKLLGIAVCGGYSARMGRDKALLDYFGKPQYQHVAEMLDTFCEKVVISCRAEQVGNLETHFPKMPDLKKYAKRGPISALLTAAECYPGFDYLLIGCDYPFLTAAELLQFYNSFEDTSRPHAFVSEGQCEPLLACYPNKVITSLQEYFSQKQYSLRHFLEEQNAVRYAPHLPEATYNANTYEEYLRAKTILSTRK